MISIYRPLVYQMYALSSLLRKLHVELAAHGVKLRLGCHVWILVPIGMAGNLGRQFLRMLDDARDFNVNLPGHLVEEVHHLQLLTKLLSCKSK